MIDPKFAETVDELARLLRTKDADGSDELLCGQTRMIVWHALIAACVTPLEELQREYETRLKALLNQAEKRTKRSEYRANIQERHEQLADLVMTGKFHLTERARRLFLGQFKEQADCAEVLLKYWEGKIRLSSAQRVALADRLCSEATAAFESVGA